MKNNLTDSVDELNTNSKVKFVLKKILVLADSSTSSMLGIVVSYVCFLLSFHFKLMIFDQNLLETIPLFYFVVILTEKVLIKEKLRNNVFFIISIIVALGNSIVILKLNANPVIAIAVLYAIIAMRMEK